MASLGTRRFWKLSSGAQGGTPQQILKMGGYISVVLEGVHYRAGSNLWQRVFGGSDRVTVTSQISYQYGADTVQAAAVQDVRKVKAKAEHYLGNGRNLALKIPADSDGFELKVTIAAVESDNLAGALELLASPDYQKPLELAPPVVGSLLTITSMIKKLFTSDGEKSRLEATDPGIISERPVPDPVKDSRLVVGYLILISNEDDLDNILDGLDVDKLIVDGDGLKYDKKPLKNTYVIYNITVDEVRGLNSRSPWYKKFQDSQNNLDAIRTSPDDQRQNIWNASVRLWAEGGALLDADPMYLQSERDQVKKTALTRLTAKYDELIGGNISLANREIALSEVVPASLAFPFQTESLSQIAAVAQQYEKAITRAGLTLDWDDRPIPEVSDSGGPGKKRVSAEAALT